jgi:hypothetical protein
LAFGNPLRVTLMWLKMAQAHLCTHVSQPNRFPASVPFHERERLRVKDALRHSYVVMKSMGVN